MEHMAVRPLEEEVGAVMVGMKARREVIMVVGCMGVQQGWGLGGWVEWGGGVGCGWGAEVGGEE